MSQEIEANIQKIRERIAAAAARANRDPAGIRLMAVSKTVEPRRILKALEAGILLLGENYVQEAREKIPAVGRGAEWHMIGHLQTNRLNMSSISSTGFIPWTAWIWRGSWTKGRASTTAA